MRVLDEKGNEIVDPDLELGRLEHDTVTKHHPETPEVPLLTRREVLWENPEDPGNNLYTTVVVQEHVPAKPAWDEEEPILRYIPYTEAELAEIAARKAAEEEAAREAEAEAQRQAELKEKLEMLPEQVGDLEVALAEAGGAIGESEASIAALQNDVADLMGAVAEIGTIVAGEEI